MRKITCALGEPRRQPETLRRGTSEPKSAKSQTWEVVLWKKFLLAHIYTYTLRCPWVPGVGKILVRWVFSLGPLSTECENFAPALGDAVPTALGLKFSHSSLFGRIQNATPITPDWPTSLATCFRTFTVKALSRKRENEFF